MDEQERREYTKKCNREIRECRDRCEKANGTEGHIKAALLWQKAWDMGHSAGLTEVALMYDELAELVTLKETA